MKGRGPLSMGRDIMSEILEKDPSLPWIVCPLIVDGPFDWIDGAAPRPNSIPENRLAGYLTFDNGRHDIERPTVAESVPESEIVDVADQWASFQNDLIHQTALFGACIAQRGCFTSLLTSE